MHSVIQEKVLKVRKENTMKKKAVIVDIDDTLFEEVPNWSMERDLEWVEECKFMPPLEVGISLTKAFKESGFALIFLSARGQSCLEVTWKRFDEVGLSDMVDEMIHRPIQWEGTPPVEYKRAMMKDIMRKWDVKFALDDSDKNLTMFAEFGIKTIDAKFWNGRRK